MLTHHHVTILQALTVPGLVSAVVLPGVVMRLLDIRKERRR